MADTKVVNCFSVRRVDGSTGPFVRNIFPVEHDENISEVDAINLAIEFNNYRVRETDDFYVVLKNNEPLWSPATRKVVVRH